MLARCGAQGCARGSGEGGGRSCLRQDLVGMFLWITQEVTSRGCDFLVGGGKYKNNLKTVEVFLCPCCGQVCLGYFPTSILPVEWTLSILEVEDTQVAWNHFLAQGCTCCPHPRLMFPWQSVVHSQCPSEQSKPEDREPEVKPGMRVGGWEVVLVVWGLSW